MAIADPAWARARVCCPAWQRLYESAFAELEDTLSHTRVRLLAAQHGHRLDAALAVMAQWRALLERRLRDGREPDRPAAEPLPAAGGCAAAITAATVCLAPEVPADHWYWTSPNAESVLVDAGAGVVAYERGVRAQVRRRPGEAADWWRCAAATHHPSAAFEMAARSRARNDVTQTRRWWDRTAATGSGAPFGVPAALLPPA
ncbi:hypothetical protein [Actinacidiphila paucisporea]|uniref:Uncharacterized protein n=1 Tax=Actinacidiphila paucisporea TaxID=310782 RepID=A0A1M7PQJ6_9ACTN|nr:hypothetical protein [Actinacidiphila paucisporea]SHN19623.1 hypothetical protein SAMN05216499_12512 [Actinacidiphila paucisporea]